MRLRPSWFLVVSALVITPALFAANAQPTVTISTPTATPFIGDPVSYSLSFSNPSLTITGYGPYIDLVLPTTGTDGYDGISFGSATFLGAPLVSTVITLNTATTQYHPYAKDNLGNPMVIDFASFPGARTGDQFVVIQLPFGSFTPTQPPAVVTVNATMDNRADVNVGMKAYARAGFQFGNDPLDNAASGDPTLIQGAPVSTTVTPTVLTAAVKNNAPESETATGPNFPRQFTVTVDVATGQKVTQVDISDVLPNNLQFVSLDSVTVAGGFGAFNQSIFANPLVTNPGIPGGTITVRLTPVAANFVAQAGTDVTMVFTAYVPRLDASNNPVLNAATGAPSTSVNTTNASILWKPIDPLDPQNVLVSALPTTDTLIDRSIAIQKGNSIPSPLSALGPIPGDTIFYTLNVQVSDYFAYDTVVITDVLSDGQHYNIPPSPNAQFALHGGTSASAAMNGANFSFSRDLVTTGQSTLILNISGEAVSRGFGASPGKFPGGGIPDTGTGALIPPNPNKPPLTFNSGTTAQIVYQAIIDDKFTNNFPSGEPALNANDAISNNVTVAGHVLDVTSNTLASTGNSMTDTSGSGLKIAPPKLIKSIYALNGSTVLPSPLIILPGDQLTYRLEYTLPTGDVENLKLNDFCPLPIFLVGDPLANGSNAAFIFDDLINAAAPAAGHVKFGPTETFRTLIAQPPPINQGAVPFVTINNASGNNTVIFNYGTFSNTANTQQKVDVLFTVTVTNLPFADDLFLTNQAQSSENSTQVPGTPINDDKIVQVHVGEPGLTPIYKGVVSYAKSTGGVNLSPLSVGGPVITAPPLAPAFTGGTKLTTVAQAAAIGASDLISPTYPGVVDAGDIIRYAVVLQNTGHGDSYNVSLSDTYPTDMVVSSGGLNLTLIRGDGTVMTAGTDYTATTTASGYSITLIDNYNVAPGTGAINRGQDASNTPTADGSNAVVVLFDLQVATTATAKETITNTATLTSYTSTPSGPNFVGSAGITDSAKIEIAPASATKILVGTEINSLNNDNSHAVIGEFVTYQLVVTVPEGTTSAAKVVDTLGAGLGFVDVTSVTLSSGVSPTRTPGTGTTPTNVTIAGQVLTFDFGDIVNSNANDAVADTITIQYRAIVLDVIGNQTATVLKNSMVFSYTYVSPLGVVTPIAQAAQQASVTVIEPTLTIANKTSNVNGSYVSTYTGADAFDTQFYQVIITNGAAATDTDAFDITLADVFPTQLQSLTVVSVASTGTIMVNGSVTAPTTGSFAFTGNTLNLAAATNIDMFKNSTITIIVSGTLDGTVQPGQVLSDPATITWTSLNGTPGLRTSNAASTERDGSGGVNDYTTASTATCNVLSPVPVKSLISQSETHLIANEVAIGEVVRYRLAWQIPEGKTSGLTFTDNLPSGMQFINTPGKTNFAFVSASGTLTSSDSGINSATPALTSVATPTAILPAANITAGATPIFAFGDVTNTDNVNGNVEYVIVEFNAVVLNVTANQAFDNQAGTLVTTTLGNNFVVKNTGLTISATSNTVNVQVCEPLIRNFTKTVVPTTNADAGDTITYTITFSNTATLNNRFPAYDVHVTDALNANLNLISVSVTAPTASTVSTAATTTGIGGTADIVIDRLDPVVDIASGPSVVTITVTAKVINNPLVGFTIPNTANLTFTSLPGANGTTSNPTGSPTPGGAGTATGERDGSNGSGTDAAKLNNYAKSASVSTTLGVPSIDARYKDGSITNDDTNVASSTGASIVVGEAATYDILVTLAEGTNKAVVVRDLLPAGLRFDQTFNSGAGFQIITAAASSGGQLAADFSDPGSLGAVVLGNGSGSGTLGNDGIGPKFTFGDVVVTADNATNNNQFIIRMQVISTDVTTNRTGQNLVGVATLDYTNPNTGSTATIADSNNANNPQFTIVEPILTVVKNVSAPAADAGDPLTYTITIGNVSGQTAYDVKLGDTLPVELTSPVINSVTGAATTANFQIVTVGPNQVLQSDPAVTLDLATGTSVVITVSGSLSASVSPGQQINNTANVFWTSTSQTKVANPDERTGQSVPNPVSGTINNAFLDNYAISSTVATTSVSQVIVSKAIVATSEASTANANVTIGEKITYRLTVSVPEGTINNFRITDNIPAGQQYLAGTIALSTFCPANIAAAHPGINNRTNSTPFAGTVSAPTEVGGPFVNGTVVNFDFGAINNPGNNSLEDNTFFFTYQTVVLDVPGNIGFTGSQTTMTNAGTSNIQPAGAPSAILVDPNNPPNTFGVTTTCVEPKMGIVKNIVQTVADAGDTVNVSLTVTNTGTSTSFDTIIQDQLDPTQFVIGSVAPITTAAGFTFSISGGGLIQYTGGTMPFTGAGSTATFTFTVALKTTLTPSQVVSNTATVTQATTLPGVDAGERNEPPVSSTDTLTIRANSISGFVFHDVNNNANIDVGDTGLGNVTVTLTGTDYLGNPVTLTTTTNPGVPLGGYTFGNLRPGTYSIVVTHPVGYIDGKNKAGTPVGGTSGGFGSNQITNIVIPTGATSNGINYNFGELLPSSLGGTVYDDRDASKTFNAGDVGINGVIVTLTGTDDTGASIGSVVLTTAGAGAYNFTGLRPGTYTITETQPVAFADYFDNVGSQGSGTVTAPPGDAISNITLNENVTGTNNNFGERQFANINGYVYHDANNDGLKTGAEIGLSGNTINLTGNDDLGNAVSLTINTDVNGFFSFLGLRPSDVSGYTLTEPTNPPGYSSGINTVGTQGGTTFSAPNDHINLNLPAGVTAANYLFGKHFITCDLSLTKTVDIPNPNINDVITYTITVFNSGPDTATNVAVTDVLPAGISFVSSLASQGSYNNGTSIWTVGTIASGANKTLQIKATVLTVSAVTNTAQVSACDQPDPDSTPGNNAPGEDDQASVTIAGQIVDLSLTKVVDITNPNINDVITYTITVSNAGPNTATNVAVTDILPAGVGFVGSTPSQGSYVSGTGIWTVGTLAKNGSATLLIQATVLTVNAVTNTAEVTACDQPDSDSTPNNHLPSEDDQASATIAGQIVDLSLTKVVDITNPNINDVVTFTIQVSNAGPNTATNVAVTDVLPAALGFVSATPSQGSFVSGTGIWTVGTLTSNGNATLQLKATVLTVNAVTNTAEVTACDQPDSDSTPNNHVPTEDDQASATIAAQLVDLSLTKVIDNSTPNLNDVVTYTVKVSNAGPNTATHVDVTDVLPAGLVFVGSTPSQGSFVNGTGLWSVGTLTSNGNATLQIQAKVITVNAITNTAEVTACDQPDIDSTPNNHVPTEDDQASVTTLAEKMNLAVTKVVDNNHPSRVDLATFTIKVTNQGPNTATSVVYTDLLPVGLDFVSATASQGSYDAASGKWTLGTLINGASATLTVGTHLTVINSLTNVVSLTSSDQPDTNPDDNTASATVTPQLADLMLTKTVDSTKVDFGGIATYTITLTNAGPDIATNVAVSDQLPAGLEYVSSSATQGAFASDTGIWTVGTVKVGEVKVLTLATKVVQEGEIMNVAQVSSSDQMDPNSTPNDSVIDQNDLSMVSLSGGSDLKVNAVQCFAARFNFRKANADRLVFLTTLALPADFNPANLPTQFRLNGYIFNATLDAKGRYRTRNAIVQVQRSGKNWRVQLTLSNMDIQHSMTGVVNADVKATALAPAQISVKLGASTYGVRSPQTYKARKNVGGQLYH